MALQPGMGSPPVRPSDALPQPSGTAAAGTSPDYSRSDHVHAAPSLPAVPSPGNALPLVDGTASAGISANYSREDHVHPLEGYTVATPSRVIGTTFQPNASKAVLVNYSVNVQATNPLLAGSSSASVQLLSDTSNPPVTVRATAAASSSVALAVAVAITTSNTTPLTYIVPPGHYVRLVSSVTGTGATSIVAQTEEVIG